MDRYSTIQRKSTETGINYLANVIYPEIELNEDDIYVISTEGDRYDTLAYQFYKNATYWWIIASANPSEPVSSLAIKPGLQIRIPVNPEKVCQDFIDFNNK